jgi:hypothetical protein
MLQTESLNTDHETAETDISLIEANAKVRQATRLKQERNDILTRALLMGYE